jgi:hypothetical protein
VVGVAVGIGVGVAAGIAVVVVVAVAVGVGVVVGVSAVSTFVDLIATGDADRSSCSSQNRTPNRNAIRWSSREREECADMLESRRNHGLGG